MFSNFFKMILTENNKFSLFPKLILNGRIDFENHLQLETKQNKYWSQLFLRL